MIECYSNIKTKSARLPWSFFALFKLFSSRCINGYRSKEESRKITKKILRVEVLILF